MLCKNCGHEYKEPNNLINFIFVFLIGVVTIVESIMMFDSPWLCLAGIVWLVLMILAYNIKETPCPKCGQTKNMLANTEEAKKYKTKNKRKLEKTKEKANQIQKISYLSAFIVFVIIGVVITFWESDRDKAYKLSMQYCYSSHEVCSCIVNKYLDGLTDSQIIRINNGLTEPAPEVGSAIFARECYNL